MRTTTVYCQKICSRFAKRKIILLDLGHNFRMTEPFKYSEKFKWLPIKNTCGQFCALHRKPATVALVVAPTAVQTQANSLDWIAKLSPKLCHALLVGELVMSCD